MLLLIIPIAILIFEFIPREVAFDGNQATSGKQSSIWHPRFVGVTLPDCVYVRDGYRFVGWSEDSSGQVTKDVCHINYPANVLKNAGEIVPLAEPKTYCAVWEFGDQVKAQVSVEEMVSGDSNNDLPGSGIMLRVTNNSPYVLDLGCAVRNTDRLHCVAPGQTTLAVNAVFGSEDWSQYNPEVSVYAPLEGWLSIEGEYQLAEKEVEQGKLVIEITNTGNKELHFLKARALGRTGGRYVMKENDRFDVRLAPGESTAIGFGTGYGWSDDTEWSQYERSYTCTAMLSAVSRSDFVPVTSDDMALLRVARLSGQRMSNAGDESRWRRRKDE